MLILFAADRLRKKPAAFEFEDLDRDLVLAFLDELEEKRKNSIATRNARLAAIRSFSHHVAAAVRFRPSDAVLQLLNSI
jgi:integrase/recombinase XerD